MRRTKAARALPLLLLLPGLLPLEACAGPEPPAPDVVAQVGETAVRYGEFETYLAHTVGDSESGLGSDVLSQLFDQYLDERVLVRLAVDRKLVKDEAAGSRAARSAIDALLRDALREDPPDEEVARYYEAHRGEFARPERVRLRQILTEDRKAAESALEQIASGADFGEVARRISRDPSAAAGGYQGELSRDDVPQAFADVIFSLAPGQVSRIVPADYGFHIFQVVDRPAAGVATLEEARGEILEKLRQRRADEVLAELVREGRGQYNVEVHERNLPFDYQGSYR